MNTKQQIELANYITNWIKESENQDVFGASPVEVYNEDGLSNWIFAAIRAYVWEKNDEKI